MVLGQMVEALDPSSDDQARMLKRQRSEVNGHAGPVLNLLLVGSTWSQFNVSVARCMVPSPTGTSQCHMALSRPCSGLTHASRAAVLAANMLYPRLFFMGKTVAQALSLRADVKLSYNTADVVPAGAGRKVAQCALKHMSGAFEGDAQL